MSQLTKATGHALRHVERTAIRRAMRVVEQGAFDATSIDDDGVPVGLHGEKVAGNPRRRRIALDMRQSKRNAPMYIDVLTRRLESAEKADALAAQGAPVHLNIGVVNVVVAPSYQTIDVTAEAKE